MTKEDKDLDLSGEFQGPVAVNGGEAVDARGSKGMVYKPSGPVTIETRSPSEELRDYLEISVTRYEHKMFQYLSSRPFEKPYKSLYAFDIEDHDRFFGRDAVIEDLLETITEHRMTVIYARSGAGKTSLLKAGLSPRLIQAGRMPVYIQTRPHHDLKQTIKETIAPPMRSPWPDKMSNLSLQEFLGLASHFLSSRAREFVIIFDQFEQFLLSAPEVHHEFVQALAACYDQQSLNVRFIISLRREQVVELDQFEQQIPDILQNRYLVRPMNPQEMREAITQPLAQMRQKLSFDPKLLDTLLEHLGQEDVELTHLQIICDTLFENLPNDTDQITLALYESLGAAEGILSSYLEHSLASLPAHKRATARDVLKALVSSVSTNRVLDLEAILKNIKPERDLLQDVLMRLVDKRLLRQLNDAGLPEYELAHAYLAREVMTWIDKDELENKKAQELLERELAIWRLKETPMNAGQLDVLRDHVQYLDWEQDAYPMLLHSAIYHAHDVDFWWGQVPDEEKEAVTDQIPFDNAVESLIGDLKTCKRLKHGFKATSNSKLIKPLISAIWDNVDRDTACWSLAKIQAARANIQAARALWVFRPWLTLEETRGVIGILWPLWLAFVLSAVAIIVLMFRLVPPVSAWMKKERAVRGNWVTIPAGPFVMGCNQAEAEFAEDLCLNGKATDKGDCYTEDRLLNWAGRQKDPTLPTYAIMDNEVTNAQYRQCVGAGGCPIPEIWEYTPDEINHPITSITWWGASTYCKWLDGRLPTEGEWEKAARGSQGSYFPWGNNWMTDTANIEKFGIGDVESVLYKANTDISDYGVKNMAGNVREWTTSPGKPNQIGATFTNGIISSEEIDDGYPVIIKGGCWTSERSLGMASRRRRNLVDDRRAENGFRCVCPAGAECESPWTLKWKWFGNY